MKFANNYGLYYELSWAVNIIPVFAYKKRFDLNMLRKLKSSIP